jgi:hypothetical protein
MAYDASRGQVILFGGADAAGNAMNDTWEWDGADWTRRTPVDSPSRRLYHAMAYDASRGEIVLFGGIATDNGILYSVVGDTWVWNGSNWVQRFPVTNPPPRQHHAMAYDITHTEVVLFGGLIYDPDLLADTWVWNGSNWTDKTSGPAPSPRFAHAMATAGLTAGVILFGGYDFANFYGDTWIWNGTGWALRSSLSRPAERATHAMVYDPRFARVELFAGYSSRTGTLGDTWIWRSPRN